MNNFISKELKYMVLYYLREKEILKLRLEIAPLNSTDKLRIYKRMSTLNSKIITIKECISSHKLKINYSNN